MKKWHLRGAYRAASMVGPRKSHPLSGAQARKEQDSTQQTARIGKFEFKVVTVKSSVKASERWEQRSVAIVNWLLAEWNRERVAQIKANDPRK